MHTASQSLIQNIFEPLSTLLAFNPNDFIWEKYKQFAIPKIEQGTITLRGLQDYISDYSPEMAAHELKELERIIQTITELRPKFQEIQNEGFREFKDASLEFFNTVENIHDMLEDISNVNQNLHTSLPVLKEDWDSEADQVWDFYMSK